MVLKIGSKTLHQHFRFLALGIGTIWFDPTNVTGPIARTSSAFVSSK
jgi:hypothetical protein